ncbi:MAG: response regulator transcription factor [Alistipes sp.]|nr:response regulator transcription factor [Alistipes sp.]
MAKREILIVEDDATLRRILRDVLTIKGYEAFVASDGEQGCRLFAEHDVDLVIADVMMPRMDGFEMVRRMRESGANTQFIFLSALDSAEDVVEGFRAGGHDYLRKPFDMSELLVRVESLLSRLEAQDASSELRVGKALFNADVGELRDEDRVEHLSSREAAILKMLIQNRGKVVTYQQLLLDLWGDDSYYNLRSMNVFVSHLRTKLQRIGSVQIASVRGVGYKLGCKE